MCRLGKIGRVRQDAGCRLINDRLTLADGFWLRRLLGHNGLRRDRLRLGFWKRRSPVGIEPDLTFGIHLAGHQPVNRRVEIRHAESFLGAGELLLGGDLEKAANRRLFGGAALE